MTPRALASTLAVLGLSCSGGGTPKEPGGPAGGTVDAVPAAGQGRVAPLPPSGFTHGCKTPDAVPAVYSRMHVPEAWKLTTGVPETVIALVDTGLDPMHPDLAGQVLPGIDVGTGETGGYTLTPHGTTLASLLVGTGRGDDCVKGLCPGCRVLPIRMPSNPGFTALARAEPILLATAIEAGIASGARVILVGMVTSVTHPLLSDAIAHAEAAGVVVVAPAGNSGVTDLPYPAAYPTVVSVAALYDTLDIPLPRSNFTPEVTVGAPAEAIPVASYEAVVHEEGLTSVAAAVVAGVAALAVSRRPEVTPAELRAALHGGPSLQPEPLGAGYRVHRLDALAALERTVAGATDLAVSTPTLFPRSPKAGQAAQVRAVLQSRAAASVALGGLEARLVVDGTPVGTAALAGSLGPGSDQEVTVDWPAGKVTAGPHEVHVEVDPPPGDLDAADDTAAILRFTVGPLDDPLAGTEVGVVVSPLVSHAPEVVATETHDVAIESIRRTSMPLIGEVARTFDVAVVNRGSAAEADVTVTARAAGAELAPAHTGPLGPGQRKTVSFTFTGEAEWHRDLGLRVEAVAPPGEARPSDNAETFTFAFEPTFATTLPAWADTATTDIFVDAPYQIDPKRDYLPVIVFVGDIPEAGLRLLGLSLCASDHAFNCATGDGKVLYQEYVEPGKTPQIHANPAGIKVLDDIGKPVTDPFLPFGVMTQASHKTWHRLLHIPLSALPSHDSGAEIHLQSIVQYSVTNMLLSALEMLDSSVDPFVKQNQKRGLRTLVSALPRLPGRPLDQYYDTHYHTLAEWTESGGLLSPKKAFGGPMQMVIESSYALGFTNSLTDIENRIVTTDHNVFFSKDPKKKADGPDWCPLYGPTGPCAGQSDTGCWKDDHTCDELKKMRALTGRTTGEEVTLAHGPDCMMEFQSEFQPPDETSHGCRVVKTIMGQKLAWTNGFGISGAVNFGYHLLAIDSPHIEGPWHGGGSVWFNPTDAQKTVEKWQQGCSTQFPVGWDPVTWDNAKWLALCKLAFEGLYTALEYVDAQDLVSEPNDATLDAVLGRLAKKPETADQRPFSFAAHPYSTLAPAAWRTQDLWTALSMYTGSTDRKFVFDATDPDARGFVFKGLQVMNEKIAFIAKHLDVPKYRDLNPYLEGHPSAFRRDPSASGGILGEACGKDDDAPAPPNAPSWMAATNLSFCHWLHFIRRGLRYQFDGEDDVFVRKVFGVGGTDAHGDFNYVTDVAVTTGTAFAAWDEGEVAAFLQETLAFAGTAAKTLDVVLAALALTDPKYAEISEFFHSLDVGNQIEKVNSEVPDALTAAYDHAAPSAYANAFGMVRTLALVDPEEPDDDGERAVEALRSGRALFGDGPLPFFEIDGQTGFRAADAEGTQGRWDDRWKEGWTDVVDTWPATPGHWPVLSETAPSGDPLEVIVPRFSADGRIGGGGAFDARRSVLLPILRHVHRKDGAEPPILRFQLAYDETFQGTVNEVRLWKVAKEHLPRSVALGLPKAEAGGTLQGEWFYVPLDTTLGDGTPEGTLFPSPGSLAQPFALLLTAAGREKTGPNGQTSFTRGYSNPIWVLPVIADVQKQRVELGADDEPTLTTLAVTLDFPVSVGSVESLTLRVLDADGRSAEALGALSYEVSDLSDTPHGRVTVSLTEPIPLSGLPNWDLVTRQGSIAGLEDSPAKDRYSFVIEVHGVRDRFTEDADPTFGDIAIPVMVRSGRPGVVWTEWPVPEKKGGEIASGGPIRLYDPLAQSVTIDDLVSQLQLIEGLEPEPEMPTPTLPQGTPVPSPWPGGQEHRFDDASDARALACDPNGEFVAALVHRVPAYDTPEGNDELCLYYIASGWQCTHRMFGGALADGPRRISVAAKEVPDPLDPTHTATTTRYTVAWLEKGDVWVRQFYGSILPPKGIDKIGTFVPAGYLDDTAPINVTHTPWPEGGVSLLANGAGFVTSDARPDDPSDPVDPNATAVSEDVTANTADYVTIGSTAKAGLDLYYYPLDDAGQPAGGATLLTTEYEEMKTKIEVPGAPPLDLSLGKMPGIFAEPQVTSSGDVVYVSDKYVMEHLFDSIDIAAMGKDPSQLKFDNFAKEFGFDLYRIGGAGQAGAILTEGQKLAFPGFSEPQRGLRLQPFVSNDGYVVFTAVAVTDPQGNPSPANAIFHLFFGAVGGDAIPLTADAGPGYYRSGCLLRTAKVGGP